MAYPYIAAPEDWVKAVPRGDWNQLSSIQISSILKGKNARFDKIALFMLSIEAKITEIYGFDQSLYEDVFISPAIFVVEDLDQLLRIRRNQLIKEIAMTIKQPENFVLLSAKSGYPMTYETATALNEALKAHAGLECPVRMLFDRSDRGRGHYAHRFKQPNEYEMVF